MSQAGSYRVVEDLTSGNRIFDEQGSDLTPKPLVFTARRSSRKSSARSKYEELDVEDGSRQHGKRMSKDGYSGAPKKVTQEVEKDYLKELEKVKEALKSCKLGAEEGAAQTAAVATATLRLRESAYHWHLIMPSGNDIRCAHAQVETDDITKERRYRQNQAAQTFNPVSKKKMSQTAPIEQSTSCVFASEWDLYDTYRRLSYEDEEDLDSEDLDLDYIEDVESKGAGTQRTSLASVSTEGQGGEQLAMVRRTNTQVQKVTRLPEFKYATIVAERLLASNTFHEKQVAFMGALLDHQDVTTGFHYIMNELWSFSYEGSKDRIVNALSWNTVNINVVAVGYGYGYEQGLGDSSGVVCCWSVKNPSQPERVFGLRSAVNALSFSRTHPNLLAIGCYNGAVIVLDISSQEGQRLVVNGEEGCLLYGSVGDLKWFYHTDFVVETEEIISVCGNGRVYKWNYQESYRSYEIMKLNYFQPNKKMLNPKPNQPKRKPKINMKHLNGLCISLHPKKKMIYYVSTQEGCVVQCSMSQQDRFLDMIPAHAGPVYGIVHSPFSSYIFSTYGSDWYICIWAEDLKEPLLRLYYTKQPVLGMSWSPSHSTIFVTISGHYLSMWDLARKTIVPISTVKSSTGNNFTSVQFSTTGKNILVGDVVGDVFVFSLADMPYPPFLQEEALIRALQKGCVSNLQHCAYLEQFIKQAAYKCK